MSPTTPDPKFIEDMNALIHEAQHRSFASYDGGLQREMLEKLSETDDQLANRKQQAIADGDEDMANLVLGYQCVVSCLVSELAMWIELKAGDPDKAWDALIGAQDAAVAASRAHKGFSHLPHHLARLEELERVLFPPQIFVSSGFVVGRQICSICDENYDECGHVATRPYWGKFCSIRQEDLTLDHVAIVKDPASKLCRMTQIGTGSERRNRMSGLPEPTEDGTSTARVA